MATPQQDTAAAEAPESGSVLDAIFERVDATPPKGKVQIGQFSDARANADKERGELVAAGLQVLVDAVKERGQEVEKVDKALLDSLISQVDRKISAQLDAVLHHPDFQKLEASWRGLKFLVDRTDFRKNVRIELVNASKDALAESFEDAPELTQSALYKQVYTNAYDQPGADPYSAVVGAFEVENTAQDVALIRQISQVAASAHAPYIGAVGPQFFGKESAEDWRKIPDLAAYMETTDFTKWNGFRESEDARYVGLTFPRFVLRLPYGSDTVPAKGFNYEEGVKGEDHEKYLWGNAAFAFASNLSQAFARDGWSIQIRGPQSGGKVEDLPVHLYDVGKGKQAKIPTEVPISETLEFETSNLGFIPLSVYQGRDYAAFFSANSAQRAREYDQPEATANARINARLPYVFLASRIAHYLKVLQRENIGATKDAQAVETELNAWLSGLVTKMPNPAPDQIAKYPLRAGQVRVYDVEDNPGFYRVEMTIMPHFQVEGMDISLSLVGKMPKAS